VNEFFIIAGLPLAGASLPATVALAAIATIGYMVSQARGGRAEFRLIDAMILASVVAIVGATGIPLLEMASSRSKESTLLQNLHTFRSQIELYKLEHGGEVPVAYQGSFPQLIRPTNAAGVPGKKGSKYAYGPYFRQGIPVNPLTGRSIVTLTDVFPPTEPSDNGGWLYHQPTGQIVPDAAGFLDE
jgi:type II secretory pathway pseudopilin PulG